MGDSSLHRQRSSRGLPVLLVPELVCDVVLSRNDGRSVVGGSEALLVVAGEGAVADGLSGGEDEFAQVVDVEASGGDLSRRSRVRIIL